jgi:signal-transduction protein with cAMP-binding, CBS, and nucleotidyltransferase domain
MHVNEICTWQLDKAAPQETVLDVARRMNDRNVGAIVVVDDDNRAVGIVTDRDITIRVTAQGRDPISIPVSKVMTSEPVTVSEMTTAREALYAMRAGCFRRLPVVNNQHQVVGIVTLDDLLQLFASFLTDVHSILQTEGPSALADHNRQ